MTTTDTHLGFEALRVNATPTQIVSHVQRVFRNDGGLSARPRVAPHAEPLVEEAMLAVRELEERYEPGVTLEEAEAFFAARGA